MTITKVKHGSGRIVLWECFASTGTWELVRPQGQDEQRQMVDLSVARACQRFTFKQDNDPKFPANTTLEQCKTKDLKVLEWSSECPDLNLILNMWQDLKIAVNHWFPSNLTHLEEFSHEQQVQF